MDQMSLRKKIKDKIRNITETEYRVLLSQLFDAMNYREVKITHGTQEFGKDLVFFEEDKFKEKIWYSCVVKKGDATQSIYGDIQRQVSESLAKPYDHHQFGKVKVTKVFVIVTGIFKDNTRALIAETIQNGENVVKFFEGSNIAELIETSNLQNLIADSEVEDVSHSVQKADIIEKLKDNNTIKFLEADYGIPINAIEDFRINVRTKSREMFEERRKYVEDKELSVSIKLLPELSSILTAKRPFLLHGIATSGKTTILKNLGKEFLKLKPNGYLFYFELNKTSKGCIFNLTSIINDYYLRVTQKQFDWTTQNEVLILLDGLDEVNDDNTRQCIIKEILLASEQQKCQVVLTSRSIDFLSIHEKIETHFEKFELLPLNYNEMVQIGNKILSDPSQARKFVHLIKNSELLNSFPKTPLTTILLAILLKEERIDTKELPKNITELYSKFIDLFLNKWDKGKGISEQYKFAEKEYVIRQLAEYLQKNNKVSFTEDEIEEFLSNLKKTRPIDILANPKEFLDNLCDRSSLLVRDKTDGTLKFFHLTLQEYLAASILTTKDEPLLIENFLQDWWLNSNIFYAGKTPADSNVLKEVLKLDVFPVSFEDKMNYIVNTTKVLKAVHLWDNENRKKTIISILKVFEGMISIIIGAFIGSEIITLRNKTLLDVVLWSRSFFNEFIDSSQFGGTLKSIWSDIIENPVAYNDIIRYCIAYNLSLRENSSEYLEQFIESDITLNPRWFKIVYVDINIKKLKPTNSKLVLRFKQKASEHKKYIQNQFQQRLHKHYSSITGLPPIPDYQSAEV
ncbi:NACHT domain-containing protein [Mucilaginibacter sp. AW1-7]|uniref:NACHT domain-containing protein n=1 Tax=Mucilaginibacter sp. AW1-7 TaxID=3349874 RepID=UPI003F732817